MRHPSVLIISDDSDFARTVVAAWETEQHSPGITIVTSDAWAPGTLRDYDLTIAAFIPMARLSAVFAALRASNSSAIYVAKDGKDIPSLRAKYPHLLVLPRHDGWTDALVLLASEVLKRVDAVARAQRAERLSLEHQSHASLGRYVLEMRPNINNALTSVLGNADLLLLESNQSSVENQEQIRTIHAMALRLSAIMQRLSSLAAEIQIAEADSRAQPNAILRGLVSESR